MNVNKSAHICRLLIKKSQHTFEFKILCIFCGVQILGFHFDPKGPSPASIKKAEMELWLKPHYGFNKASEKAVAWHKLRRSAKEWG